MRLYTRFDDADYSQNWIQISLLAYLSLTLVDTQLDVDGLQDEFETVIAVITATVYMGVYVFGLYCETYGSGTA